MTREFQGKQIREDWIGRQRQLGNLPRAVLMKGLHPLINETIDRWHRAVMHTAFDGVTANADGPPSLDLGCGYGRLADEAKACGLSPVIGLDFTQQFCADFQRRHGAAVCAGLSRLPFADASIRNAYSVTSLMYLSVEDAHRALAELDRCLVPGARVLVLEPSREFNDMIRMALRQKRTQTLARPGFSLAEMRELPPSNWVRLDGGSCNWMTVFLPLLAIVTRVPRAYAWLDSLVLRMDSPAKRQRARHGKLSMYRWVVYRKNPSQSRAISRTVKPITSMDDHGQHPRTSTSGGDSDSIKAR